MKGKTLAHEFLDIEAEAFEVPQSCYDTLDDLLAKAKDTIDTERAPEQILSDIGELLREEGFSPKKNGLLSHALQSGMDCQTYSAVYYSIGEELGLPISIVSVPDHAFVRYGEGDNALNWETTSSESLDDDYYIEDHNIPKKSISKGFYLRNLTREESKSMACMHRGAAKSDKGDFDGAIADYNEALRLNPNDAGAYSNRGVARERKEDHDGAIADYDRALEINPNLAKVYYNRANAKFRKEDFDAAMADYDEALRLNPDYARAYRNRGKTKGRKGDMEGAIKDFEMYEKLKNETKAHLRN